MHVDDLSNLREEETPNPTETASRLHPGSQYASNHLGVENVDLDNSDSLHSDFNHDSGSNRRKSKGYDRRLKFAKKAQEIRTGVFQDDNSANF